MTLIITLTALGSFALGYLLRGLLAQAYLRKTGHLPARNHDRITSPDTWEERPGQGGHIIVRQPGQDQHNDQDQHNNQDQEN